MNSLKEGLLSTAEEVLGRQRKKIQPWVTHEVLDLRPETAAETTEVQRHCRTTVVQKKTEQRSQEEDVGSKGRVDRGAVQEHTEGNDVRKQQQNLQHPKGCH